LGLRARCLSQYTTRPIQRGALVLGYAAANEREMREGVRRLVTALRHFG
jgi:DNA-binding transcriptional MocR family regulator